MHTRKISINKFIIPRKRSILNEQILFKGKLQITKNLSSGTKKDFPRKNFFLKDKEIQENSINEEDDYNIDIYNQPIKETFLNEINNNDNKDNTFKKIPIFNYFMGTNRRRSKIYNQKSIYNNNYFKNYYSENAENINLNLKLNHTFEEKGKKNHNVNLLKNNINMFKKIHEQRWDSNISYNISQKNLFINISKNDINTSNRELYHISNKFSRKSKNIKQKEEKIIPIHTRRASKPLNGPYLRKNKISQIFVYKYS
jgi:hypothetical protein